MLQSLETSTKRQNTGEARDGNPGISDADARRVDMDGDFAMALVAENVDVEEIYSPPRVTEDFGKYKLKPGDAMDLFTGWDISKKEHWQRTRCPANWSQALEDELVIHEAE